MTFTKNIKKSPDCSSDNRTVFPAAFIMAFVVWVRQHVHILILVIVLAIAAFFRFWAAPLSSGPDINQFWAFAKVFQAHGMDFYKFADGNLDIFPNQGWGFVYPPVWLLILGLVLLFVPSSLVTATTVDTAWRVAMKTPIIVADLAIGILLYWAVPGSKWRKLLFASLWLFHPTAWFESGVFGQFDAIAAALLLASVITLMKGKDRLAFLLAGLAIMTKQHTFIPIIMMIIVSSRQMSKRRLLTNCAVTAGVIILLSVPFLLTGNYYAYARSIFAPGSLPGYQSPLSFSFSGIGAVLSYLHDIFGWDTSSLIILTIPVMLIALIVAAVLSYKKSISPLQAALTGFLIFIGLCYRINYQYLVIYIPLALLLASQTRYRSERAFVLIMALLPAVWIWLTNMPWWFTDKLPRFPWVSHVLSPLGLAHEYLPDYAYVALAAAIMCLAITCVVLTFVRRSKDQNQISIEVLNGKT